MSRTVSRRDFLRQFATPPTNPLAAKPAVTRDDTLTAEEEASRFLAQATLGADRNLIQTVAGMGIENWIDQQFTIPKSNILDFVYGTLYDESDIYDPDAELPWREMFRFAMWESIIKGQDLLRQKVALALSEIIVISTDKDDIYNAAHGTASWYDMLLTHAFGNFRDLLFEVTIHPLMGNYLNHAGNRKTDAAANIFPDENYAREIMQLFSIGLFLLNDDGTLVLDGEGKPIPTYDNDDITEFAKIFTGLQYDSEGDPRITWPNPGFNSAWPNPYTMIRPMKMWEDEHEPGAKYLLNGFVVPNGQTGLQDINDALDNLFNHQNVGPFIGYRLIQRLVKSNPSPEYVGRVTAVFNNNGSGVRGDMQAVVKAILMDDEARSASFINDPTHGKLREPFFRFTQFVRTFHVNNAQDKFWDAGWSAENDLRQYMFNAPSVFNFFLPDFQPAGPVSDNGLVAPEFQLHNTYTAISMINFIYSRLEWGYVINLPSSNTEYKGVTYDLDQPEADLSYELTLVGNIGDLLDHLDLLLTYGTLSTQMRGIIETAVSGYADTTDDDAAVVRFAIYLFMICPEYAIQV